MSAAAPVEPVDVAQLLLHYLKLENVKHLFGVPGAAIAHILDELEFWQVGQFKYVVCKHESGAAYMAEGYFRATGRPGVVAVTSGPGATNALTGTLSAQFGGSAVVTITGEPQEKWIGRGVYQEGVESGLDSSAVYDAAVSYSARITNPEGAWTLIQEALRTAMSVPRNAVHLAIPEDIAKGCINPDPITKKCLKGAPVATATSEYRARPRGLPHKDDVQKVCDVLHSAERPIIFLGAGCREPLRNPQTYNKLCDFVDRYKIPVMTTPDGKGLFPENHELSLRVYGFASCRWPARWLDPGNGRKHDALLVIGSQLGKLSTDKYDRRLIPEKDFIQVDIDQRVIGRAFLVTHGIVADAGEFIQALSDCLMARTPDPIKVEARAKKIKEIKKDPKSAFAKEADYKGHRDYWSDRDSTIDKNGIEPAALIRVMQDVLEGKESMIFIDHANSVGWATHYLEVNSPDLKAKPPTKPKMEYHQSLGMASMGFGVCPVIGAKLGKTETGKKDCICVGLTGDGAFLMHAAEVTTAAEYKIGAIWIVLEDNDLSMVTQGMFHYTGFKRSFKGEYGLGNASLELAATAFGANAVRVHRFNDLRPALENAVKGARTGTPQVVVVHINKNRVPPYYLALYSKAGAAVNFAF